MKSVTMACVLVLGGVFFVSPSAFGQAASAPASAPAMAPAAEALLKKMDAFLKQAKNLSFTAETALVITAPERNVNSDLVWEVSIQRPDHLAAVLQSKDAKGFSTYYDGKEITFYSAADKKYLTEKAEPTIDETLKKFRGMLQHYQFIDFLKNNVFDGLLEDAVSGELGEKSKMGEAEVQEIRIGQKQGNWSIWIETGEKPWPRKIALNIERNSPQGKSQLALTLTLSKWAAPAEFPAATFAFKAPEGAEKVEPNQPQAAPADSLLHQPAPDFKLPVLGGGELELSKLKGQVVILDFWATWCPPCRKGLPIVSQVAEAFKDKGVVFYAVNEQEDEGKIKGFLGKTDLKIQVALDTEGKVGGLYKVEGIPQTVLIDKDGKVAKIHVGVSPDTKDELTKDVEALTAAKPSTSAPDKK